MIENKTHWNNFYTHLDNCLEIPSQFATFVATECVNEYDSILELGCGSGRDSVFFAKTGFNVLGVDMSTEAVRHCNNMASGLPAKFIESDIKSPDLIKHALNFAQVHSSLVIYARFFLHAIDASEEASFWSLVSEIASSGDRLALEFRTPKDEQLTKATSSHERRFIDPVSIVVRASEYGFNHRYFVEGYGYAKYKNDDAHVARLILQKVK